MGRAPHGTGPLMDPQTFRVVDLRDVTPPANYGGPGARELAVEQRLNELARAGYRLAGIAGELAVLELTPEPASATAPALRSA